MRAGGTLGCVGVWRQSEMFSTWHTWHAWLTFFLCGGLAPPTIPALVQACWAAALCVARVRYVLKCAGLLQVYEVSQRFWLRATLPRCCCQACLLLSPQNGVALDSPSGHQRPHTLHLLCTRLSLFAHPSSCKCGHCTLCSMLATTVHGLAPVLDCCLLLCLSAAAA